MKKLFSILVLIALAALPARAGVDRWTPFGRGGDYLLDLLQKPEGLYAVTGDGRVFRSTDAGVTWQYWGVGLATGLRQIVAEPADPRVMTAVSFYGDVYRSVDAGRFWSLLPQGVDENSYPVVSSLASAAGTIYVGGQYLHISRDNGVTWTDSTPVQSYVPDIVVDPADPRTVWFASGGGLWKTADAGETFSLSLNPAHQIGKDGVTAVAVAPSRSSTVYAGANRRLYASQDGGATWQAGGPIGSGIGIGDVSALAVDPGNPAKVWASGPGGIALSQDGGATWTVLAPKLGSSALILAPDGTLFAGTYADGLQASRDGGRSWSRRDRVGMGYASTWFTVRDPRRPSVLYLAHSSNGFGLLRSTDDGRTWAPFTKLSGDLSYLVELAFDKRRPGVLYAVNFLEGAWRIDPNGKTTRMTIPQRDINTIATSGPAILAGSSWAGHRSEDGGQTWKEVLPHVVGKEPGGGKVSRRVLRFVEDPLGPGTVYALTIEEGPSTQQRYVALRTDDTGLHWRPIRTGDLQVLAVDPEDAGTIYSVETEGDQAVLYRSGDRGGTWRRIGPIPGRPQGWVTALVVDTKHPGVLWAATDLDVLRSEDGGGTWTPFNAGLARPGLTSLFRLVSDPAVPGRLYGMPVGGGLFELTLP